MCISKHTSLDHQEKYEASDFFNGCHGKKTLISIIKTVRKNRVNAAYGAFSSDNSPVVITEQVFKQTCQLSRFCH